jgi:hypothetical protein
MTTKTQSLKLLSSLCAFGLAVGAYAQNNLVLNPNFTVGGSASSANWSNDGGGGSSCYYEGTVSANIFSFGWWSGVSIWQNTTATIQPGASYALDVTAQVGQSPVTGLNLTFQDVTQGWSTLDGANYTFTSQSSGPSQWETFELDIPASALAANVGDTIGVGVAEVENPSTQYGWVWVDSVSLVQVPEPSMLALGALGALLFLGRRSK